jgi:uncharacterized membrane protein YuzA (DUF378 family)
MQFAKIIFRIAAVWGFLILLPMYFSVDKLSEQNPPPVTHTEFYYGFVGLALVWQIAFFLIATDPVRFRPIMLAAIPEKFIFVITVLILARHQAMSSGLWVGVVADFVLGVLFVIAYVRTPRTA